MKSTRIPKGTEELGLNRYITNNQLSPIVWAVIKSDIIIFHCRFGDERVASISIPNPLLVSSSDSAFNR
jgi:hypothetical protein